MSTVASDFYLTTGNKRFSGTTSISFPPWREVSVEANVRGMSAQSYFWTIEWQQGEREADDDIRKGRLTRFTDSETAIAWLNEPCNE